MPSGPFTSALAKFNRGEFHAATFRDRVGAKSHPIRVAGNLRRDTRFVQMRAPTNPVLPAEMGAIIGDAIHNFRSCLDHIMWAMTELDGGKTGTWTQFPILPDDDWTAATRWRARKSLAELSRSHQGIVKAAQPYQGWNGPGRHPLLDLDKLEIIDKHRQFNTIEMLPIGTSFRVLESRDCDVQAITAMGLGKRLEEDAVVAQIELVVTGPKPYIDVQADFAPEIEFENGRSVSATLEAIHGYIDVALFRSLIPNMRSGWARTDQL